MTKIMMKPTNKGIDPHGDEVCEIMDGNEDTDRVYKWHRKETIFPGDILVCPSCAYIPPTTVASQWHFYPMCGKKMDGVQ